DGDCYGRCGSQCREVWTRTGAVSSLVHLTDAILLCRRIFGLRVVRRGASGWRRSHSASRRTTPTERAHPETSRRSPETTARLPSPPEQERDESSEPGVSRASGADS